MGKVSGIENYTDEEFEALVSKRRKDRFETIDNMTPELRELVYDYGLSVVQTALQVGIKKPKQIRHMVETVLNEFSPTRGNFSSQGRPARGHR